MQNNVTDLSQKLQRSLDNNYNVIDMPAVIEIISTLEKTSVTKELLETTRLGKYINELRRRTSNEALAKRAKDLLKKWRDLILPEANGQVRASQNNTERSESPDAALLKARKRPARDTKTDPKLLPVPKRPALNGQSREFDFSDNSNCSIKDLKKTDVIFINSDSNSSMPDQSLDSVGSHSNLTNDTATFDEYSSAQPKKRGRKKGSKNHKNLVIAAEESFSNKMAMSKNSKVKTTQELLADLQNRTVVSKQNQDIELRAAQLTESLSRIDQKLNPQRQLNKGSPLAKSDKVHLKPALATGKTAKSETDTSTLRQAKTSGVAGEQWSLGRTTPEIVVVQSDDEIVDVCGTDSNSPPLKQTDTLETTSACTTQTAEDILKQLPPIDLSTIEDPDSIPECICPLPHVTVSSDKITVEIVDDNKKESKFSSPLLSFTQPETCAPVIAPCSAANEVDSEPKPEPQPPDECSEVSDVCPARLYLRAKYDLDTASDNKVNRLQTQCLPNVNGNWGLCRGGVSDTLVQRSLLYDNIVPNMSTGRLRRDLTLNSMSPANENYNKYSISIGDNDGGTAGDDGVKTSASSDGLCDSERTTGVANVNAGVAANSNNNEFREWHETLDVLSYNGETLRILPYVIID